MGPRWEGWPLLLGWGEESHLGSEGETPKEEGDLGRGWGQSHH